MSKKFDVVIGNPPYQEEAQGDATNQMPIYHRFMEAAYEVGEKAVLITPARFLFNAGYTPKAWNAKMLEDPHLTVPHYVPDSASLFPGTDIKGGVVVTYRDTTRTGEPIGIFTKYPELNSIIHKLTEQHSSSLVSLGISNDRVYRYTQTMHNEHPQLRALMSGGNQFKLDSRAFERLAAVFFEERPTDGAEYMRVLGLDGRKRSYRWIRSDYITGPVALFKHKVALPKANGSGAFGETLAPPIALEPATAVTGTFITIGAFDTQAQAEACLKYVKSKFARTLLGVLKVTQDNLARVWEYVPAQDFTTGSEIDWSRSIPEIDQQLYARHKLDPNEIAFIESHVKPMV
ncbi:restriction endonuclease [Microbacterium foliorum]|uniref:Restriction endonuclease n=1 Tax=Microbacterium foliorum TaxID=104336 RepID=A0A4Y5YL78_9MICO|nr:Eco57I restriction-modification methylase domain-containing protein [Microbacterium foliorum]QDE33517.1 restriction endonuclease [Microbacterium foliorum]